MHVNTFTGKHYCRKDWRYKRTKRIDHDHLTGKKKIWFSAEWNCSKRHQRLKRQAAKMFRKHDRETAYNGNLSRKTYHLSWELW